MRMYWPALAAAAVSIFELNYRLDSYERLELNLHAISQCIYQNRMVFSKLLNAIQNRLLVMRKGAHVGWVFFLRFDYHLKLLENYPKLANVAFFGACNRIQFKQVIYHTLIFPKSKALQIFNFYCFCCCVLSFLQISCWKIEWFSLLGHQYWIYKYYMMFCKFYN